MQINSGSYFNKNQSYYGLQSNYSSFKPAFKGSRIPSIDFDNFLQRSETKLDWSDHGYIRTYIACPDKLFEDKVIPCIQKETKISEENTVFLDIQRNGDLGDTILSNLPKILSKIGDNLLVILKGFEKNTHIAGHSYDQSLTITDTQLKQTGHSKLTNGAVYAKSIAELLKGKKMFLVTHISDSSGKNLYDKSLATAKDSQFKDDWIELTD